LLFPESALLAFGLKTPGKGSTEEPIKRKKKKREQHDHRFISKGLPNLFSRIVTTLDRGITERKRGGGDWWSGEGEGGGFCVFVEEGGINAKKLREGSGQRKKKREGVHPEEGESRVFPEKKVFFGNKRACKDRATNNCTREKGVDGHRRGFLRCPGGKGYGEFFMRERGRGRRGEGDPPDVWERLPCSC